MLFKKKDDAANRITFYPHSEKSMQFAPPPQPASKSVPEWYKKQPANAPIEGDPMSQGFPPSTVKRCMPIFDSMTAGYLILAPCDIYLDATDPEKLVFSVPAALKQFQGDLFASHSRPQYSEYPIDQNKYHRDLLRLMPFWAIGTEKGYSCLIIDPLHKDDSPISAFSGIVDTDRFITDGHYSFLVKKDFKGVIKQGTPLVQVFPFKREAWFLKIADPSESADKFNNQRLKVRSSFTNSYKNKFRSKKEYR